MKHIIAIGASSSKSSINRELANYAASQIGTSKVLLLDLNDFEMPIYSSDREEELGIPEQAIEFLKLIGDSQGVVISLAEHNGSYSAAFKNILDWASRARKKADVWQNKPMLLLSTSPGGRGGASVMGLAQNYFPYMAAKISASFSLPKYYENFSVGKGVSDSSLNVEFQEAIELFRKALEV
jgi:chromate reductase